MWEWPFVSARERQWSDWGHHIWNESQPICITNGMRVYFLHTHDEYTILRFGHRKWMAYNTTLQKWWCLPPQCENSRPLVLALSIHHDQGTVWGTDLIGATSPMSLWRIDTFFVTKNTIKLVRKKITLL